MKFKEFEESYSSLTVGSEFMAEVIEENLPVIKEMETVEYHEYFYPAGIYTDKKLDLFFFSPRKFSKVAFQGESLTIETTAYHEISKLELKIIDQFRQELTVFLQNGGEITLNNEKDASSAQKEEFKEAIAAIHQFLLRSM